MAWFSPLLSDPISSPELAGEPAPLLAAGFSKLNGSYSGPICILRESVGNTQATFYPLENGQFPYLQVLGFKGAGNVFIVTLFDQSGNGWNLSNATAAQQPQLDILHTALNNTPAILFGSGSNFRLTTDAAIPSIFGSGGVASFVIDAASGAVLNGSTFMNRTAIDGAKFIQSGTTPLVPQFSNTSSGANATFKTTSTQATGVHTVDVQYDASSVLNTAIISLDGVHVSQTNTQPTGTITPEFGAITLGNDTANLGFAGYIAEFVVFNSSLSLSQLAVLRSRQKLRFRTP